MISAGIIGGSGYTAGELLRILLHHPEVKIDFVFSTTNAGKPISDVHYDLLGETNLNFTDEVNPAIDVVFLCLGHGKSIGFLKQHVFSKTTRIVDLGNDFRLHQDANFNEKQFVYGLPELYKNEIKDAKYIANPGCFATAIQLALMPLAKNEWLQSAIHINATTGSTGAGVQPSQTSHHPWRSGNMSHYKAFEHQHLDEIFQSLKHLQPEFSQEILFIPNRGDFTRGIFATLYMKAPADFETILKLYSEFYENQPFVTVTTENISLKSVLQTNKCVISIEQKGDYLLLTAVIDNLVKGASGQAVQNMNLMFGFDENTGLKLKASGF